MRKEKVAEFLEKKSHMVHFETMFFKNQVMSGKRFGTAGVNACFSHLTASTPNPLTDDGRPWTILVSPRESDLFCGDAAAGLET